MQRLQHQLQVTDPTAPIMERHSDGCCGALDRHPGDRALLWTEGALDCFGAAAYSASGYTAISSNEDTVTRASSEVPGIRRPKRCAAW